MRSLGVAWAVLWQCWMSPPDCSLLSLAHGSSHKSASMALQWWHCLHLLGFICVCADNNELALEQGGQETYEQLWILSSTPKQCLASASLIPSCLLGRQWPFGKAFLISLTAVEVAGNSQPEEKASNKFHISSFFSLCFPLFVWEGCTPLYLDVALSDLSNFCCLLCWLRRKPRQGRQTGALGFNALLVEEKSAGDAVHCREVGLSHSLLQSWLQQQAAVLLLLSRGSRVTWCAGQ